MAIAQIIKILALRPMCPLKGGCGSSLYTKILAYIFYLPLRSEARAMALDLQMSQSVAAKAAGFHWLIGQLASTQVL